MVQLTEELVELLDIEASRRGISRSALIREAVGAHLAESREAAIGRAIVEGYRRIPPGTPDEWGDLEGLGERGGQEALERLDTEERRAGSASW